MSAALLLRSALIKKKTSTTTTAAVPKRKRNEKNWLKCPAYTEQQNRQPASNENVAHSNSYCFRLCAQRALFSFLIFAHFCFVSCSPGRGEYSNGSHTQFTLYIMFYYMRAVRRNETADIHSFGVSTVLYCVPVPVHARARPITLTLTHARSILFLPFVCFSTGVRVCRVCVCILFFLTKRKKAAKRNGIERTSCEFIYWVRVHNSLPHCSRSQANQRRTNVRMKTLTTPTASTAALTQPGQIQSQLDNTILWFVVIGFFLLLFLLPLSI